MPPLPWLEGATRDRGEAATSWRVLSPAQIRMIERAASPVMRELGYQPAQIEHEPGRLYPLHQPRSGELLAASAQSRS